MLVSVLLDQLCPSSAAYTHKRMTDEQFEVGPPPLHNIYQTLSECQTGLMFQSEQKKLDEATYKLDKLSQELDSMWSTQSSPVVTDAAPSDSKAFWKESSVTTSSSSKVYGPSWTESQTKRDELLPVVSVTRSPSPRTSPAYTPLPPPQQPPSPYAFSPLFDRAPSPRAMMPGSPMLIQEPRAPLDRAPSPRAMLPGSPMVLQQEPRAPLDRAPSPRAMMPGSPMLIQQDLRAPLDRAPSPRAMMPGSPMLIQEPRAPLDRAPSPRAMMPGSLMVLQQEPRAPLDRAPSPRAMMPGSPMLIQEPRAPLDRAPSPRTMMPGSPMLIQEPRAPLDRAPSPRTMMPGSPMLIQEPRAPLDRAPSPRPGFIPVTPFENAEPSIHPLAGAAHEAQTLPSGTMESPLPQQPGLLSPVPSAYPGPLGPTRVSPRENFLPPLSAASRLPPDHYKKFLEAEDGRAMSGFALNPGVLNLSKDDSLKKKKPGVWAEADLDIAYEKRPSQIPSYETKHEQNWSTAKHEGSWRQTDLDLAVIPNKTAGGRNKAFNLIQIYGTLPKGTVPLHWRHETAQQQRRPPLLSSPQHSPWPNLPSPIVSRTNVPPHNPRPSSIKERRNVLPLSVLIRPTIVKQGRGRMTAGARLPQGQIGAPPTMRYPQLQPVAEVGRKVPALSALPLDAMHYPLPLAEMGEVETEIANILQPGDSPDPESIPRPLSPTRLQPVSLPDSEAIQDMEELMRIRAAIPRPLKRRTSIEQPVQQLVPMQKQARLYQQLTKLFARSGASQRKHQEPAEGSALPSSPQTSPTSDTHLSPNLPTPILEFPSSPSTLPVKRSILKQGDSSEPSTKMRARLNPLVVLLDAALLGELEVVKRVVFEMDDPSQSNDEGITGLHNAVCGGHYDIVEFLVNFGVNINVADGYGWTPLHCAASCNDLAICTFLVKKGAAIFSTTLSDGETAAEKCDRYLDGYEECARFLFSAEQQAGMMNSAVVYALWDYEAENSDELSFREGETITILQRGDKEEKNWWWASLYGREGYVPYNLLGLFPRVRPAV
ncbi:relA-associated inhibitor isoform X3 [Chiloscyllium punctatum]|uniref:relA-associated inhibitor isoform X3 n=1 Tax=Chiloscyllium punctatum TaxID=137246 RepID=UPI003B6320D0